VKDAAVVELRGSLVTLRPYRPDEVERHVALAGAPDGGSAQASGASFAYPMGPPPPERLRQRAENSGRFVDSHLELAVETNGELVGSIQARNPLPCFPPGVFMIGIAIEPEFRGRGIGGEAIALLTSYLFQTEGAERVETPTDVDNAPMRRVNERLGFVLEGTLRALMPMGDERRDYCMYAMTRTDWENVKDRWTSRS
jgi:RimJ/RimL family protein N-acetyltransferase